MVHGVGIGDIVIGTNTIGGGVAVVENVVVVHVVHHLGLNQALCEE